MTIERAALTAKQEAFAQAIVKGLNQSDAYRRAYNASKMKATSVNVNACKIMADAKVAQRVAFLRAPVAAKLQYGLEEAMREANDALAVSKAKDNGGAMVAAVTLRAKLMGLLVEKREVRTGPLDGVPAAEAAALIEAIDVVQRARATAIQ